MMIKINKKNIGVLLAILVTVSLVTGYIYLRNILYQYGDSSFAAQMLNNLKNGQVLDSSITTSISDAYTNIWYRTSEEVCSNSLIVSQNKHSIPHLYLIVYFLFPLTKLMDIQVLVAFLHAISYVIPVLVFALFAKKRGIPWWGVILFGVLITQHPLWIEGLRGQFYFNRLFLPLMALIAYEVHARKYNPVLLSFYTILALSTNEIYGFMLSLFYVLSYVFFKKRSRTIIVLAPISFMYSAVAVLYLQKTFPSVSTQTGAFADLAAVGIQGLLPHISKMLLSIGTAKLLFVNLISCGLLFALKPKYGLMALLFFIPNLLITVGGAEKTGWSTHYHIGYFIPLLWLCIEAYIHSGSKRLAQYVFIGTLLATMMFQYDIVSFQLKPSRFEAYRLVQQMAQFYKDRKSILEYKRSLQSLVPEHASVTAPEAAMYNLYQREIYLYPMNIDSVDIVILRYYAENPEGERIASINYGHQDKDLDVCIFERMKRNGFTMENGIVVGNWIVIKKEQ